MMIPMMNVFDDESLKVTGSVAQSEDEPCSKGGAAKPSYDAYYASETMQEHMHWTGVRVQGGSQVLLEGRNGAFFPSTTNARRQRTASGLERSCCVPERTFCAGFCGLLLPAKAHALHLFACILRSIHAPEARSDRQLAVETPAMVEARLFLCCFRCIFVLHAPFHVARALLRINILSAPPQSHGL